MNCPHEHVTLCQGHHEEFGRFVAYQCDDCGLMLPRMETPDEALDDYDLPWIDEPAWDDAIGRLDHEKDEFTTMQFFSRAMMI